MGFGLWVLLDNESFLAVLRKYLMFFGFETRLKYV